MFPENIKIRLKSGRALTGLKDKSDGLLPLPLYAVGLVQLTAASGWTSLCSVKRRRPFPLGGRGWNLPIGESDGCLGCCSPAHHVGIRVQNYCDSVGCGIGANCHLQPLHRHLQPTAPKPFQPRLNMCSFAYGNSSANIKICNYESK